MLFGFFSSYLSLWLVSVELWFGRSSELSLSVTDTSPIFDDLLLLSSHFDEESSTEYFFIVVVSNEVDGVDSHFKDDFEWSRVVIFDFDELEVRECFFDIFFSGVEVTLDEIQSDMLYFLIEIFDLLNEFISAGDWELSFLLLFLC